MKISGIKLCVLATILSGVSTFALAEGSANSAVRWIIDSEGVPKVNTSDSFDGWHSQALPDGQQAVAISGDYRHFSGGPGSYSYKEYSAFAASHNGVVFRDSANGWQRIPGCWGTRDISSHSLEYAYCVNGDGTLMKYNQDADAFSGYIQLSGEVINKIDVDKDGAVWAVTESSSIYKYSNESWQQIYQTGNYSPIDIAVGGGDIYLISNWINQSGIGGGQGLFSFKDGQFDLISTAYTLVDVDRDNIVWVAEKNLDLISFKRPGMKDFVRHAWHVSDGKIVDIGM